MEIEYLQLIIHAFEIIEENKSLSILKSASMAITHLIFRLIPDNLDKNERVKLFIKYYNGQKEKDKTTYNRQVIYWDYQIL